ncbi:MAG: Nif3-like dinuclear metal center hexameric protein [Clostridia bacterium]|nr:Nif3-like dinuclear metal center hexameric protein [Clostridia bacterium]
MKIRELYASLDALWPRTLSAEWDNDGLMCAADPEREAVRAVVSLDATLPAIIRAKETGSVLVTHHPMIFRGAKNVVAGDAIPDRIIEAVRSGVAVMSFHTRLDAADCGVNDALAEKIGVAVSGTFGDEECPTIGRIGTLAAPVTLDEFSLRVKNALGSPLVRVTGDGSRIVSRIAAVGGSGGDFIDAARAAGADVLVTGEVGYNRAEDGAETGKIAVLEAGHYHSEAPVLPVIANALGELGIETEIFESYPQWTI